MSQPETFPVLTSEAVDNMLAIHGQELIPNRPALDDVAKQLHERLPSREDPRVLVLHEHESYHTDDTVIVGRGKLPEYNPKTDIIARVPAVAGPLHQEDVTKGVVDAFLRKRWERQKRIGKGIGGTAIASAAPLLAAGELTHHGVVRLIALGVGAAGLSLAAYVSERGPLRPPKNFRVLMPPIEVQSVES